MGKCSQITNLRNNQEEDRVKKNTNLKRRGADEDQ